MFHVLEFIILLPSVKAKFHALEITSSPRENYKLQVLKKYFFLPWKAKFHVLKITSVVSQRPIRVK